jgi:glutaredoxin
MTLIVYKITPRKKKKIIIGVSEIANILNNLKLLFNNDCIVVCKNRNHFYKKNDYDIDISGKSLLIRILYASILLGKLAKNANFFIYLWNDGFLLNREFDFKFLKKHNIPIVCSFLGDDIRSRKLFLEYCKRINFNAYVEYDRPEIFLSDKYDNEKRILAEQADKFATIIFSHQKDQMSYIKSKQYFFPPIIDENLFSQNRFNEEKFNQLPVKIVHAPSSPVLKGTPIVRSVIKTLKNEGYDFQYIELINTSHEEVIKALNQSHIVLNQFYAYIPGIFGLEAMATCNAVLMSAKSDQFPYFFNNAWLETEDWQLYYNLKFLLEHHEKIIEYAKNGFEYITKNYTIKAIREYLTNIFNENGIVFRW